MTADYLIVGQGIAGSLLAWNLVEEGQSVCVIDNAAESTPSKVAAGIINPVTGRRYHTTWKVDELHPFALNTYRALDKYFNTMYIYPKDIIECFPSPESREIFIEKINEGNPYMRAFADQNRFNDILRYDFDCGEIGPAYVTSVALLLADIRKWLTGREALRQEQFRHADLRLTDDGIIYGDITAKKILFCEGSEGPENPWFRLLPYALNKGEALIIECPGLPDGHIIKKSFLLAPLPVKDTFWAGSSYAWTDLQSGPTSAFRERTEKLITDLLKIPFTVLQHKAGVRPATVERRPFVGLHPAHPQIGILNGMGTKGTSLAPYFASQLKNHLLHDSPLTPEADVRRFNRLLSRDL